MLLVQDCFEKVTLVLNVHSTLLQLFIWIWVE